MRKYIAFVMVAAVFAAGAQERSVAAPKLLRAQDLTTEVEPEALQRQFIALQAMRLESVEYSPFLGSVKRLVGRTGLVLPSRSTDIKVGDASDDVLQLLGDVLLAKGTETLRVTRHDEAGSAPYLSSRQLRFTQEINGIPVVSSFLGIRYDYTTKEITELAATFVPDRGLDRVPRISAVRAEQLVPEALAAMKDSAAAQVEILEGTHLAYYHERADPTLPRLIWVVRAQLGAGQHWAYYVDAIRGVLIERVPLSLSLTAKVYNANGAAWSIPGQVPSQSMSDAQIAANPMAQEAKNHVLNADTQLRLRFPSLLSARFPTQTRQIIQYGFGGPAAQHIRDGSHDYILYSGPYSGPQAPRESSTKPPDITYHEYTHGIGRRLFPLIPNFVDFQWGAIQEAFGDIGASAVQIGLAGAPSPASWQMGEGWFVNSPNTITRSMSNPAAGTPPYAPNADWYPFRYMNFYTANGPKDYSHYNSTILSHAYYLSINGGMNAQWLKTYIPEITVPALDPSPATAEYFARQIFIAALDDPAVADVVTMYAVKQAAMNAASALYPFYPARRTSIQTAFEAVGVGHQCSEGPPTAPSPILEDLMCQGRYVVTWPDLPGANRYIAQIAPQVYGWSFGRVAVDGDLNQCTPQISTYSMFRMMACNNCGCGPWSQTQYMYHWPGQCP